jgi:hypothetical protein
MFLLFKPEPVVWVLLVTRCVNKVRPQ